ncbi:ABC transporter substrate-binding protein [Anabaena azotica]|uniref:ABC transporter substrate-binding protein n=1 Tax=Anabaena azotica FACHB-119 TaxID=947527 RepID=A0ABR8DEN8_9NOST|nr:ABC transporter substrate-binding protein [Anabaena azotica]MBD2504973.1 ABC transporter substrate-binding protein [Anabaena azotica FACHB-119]
MVSSSSSPQPHENVSVILEFSDGSFDNGFSVKLRILEDGVIIREDNDFPIIPAAPAMPQLYDSWQNTSLENSRKLQAVPAQITHQEVDTEAWKERAEALEQYCRSWFKHWAFKSLRDCILANININNNQSIPIIIRCQAENNDQNELLRRIPWHTWDLFTSLKNAEFALFTKFSKSVPTLAAPVRVLAIFGSPEGGLRLEEDRKALELLEQRGAQITKIFEPDDDTLSHLFFDQEWQILFFAGHSSSEGMSGKIQISTGICIPLHTLEKRFTSAVTKGLKLAIFNSCDGLKIADFLSKLNVPTVIVMREPVADRIAYQFLLHFLQEFSQGVPLCLAVRKGRDRLESLQRDFPAATWLPTVCLNPNQSEFVWPDDIIIPPPPPSPFLLLLNSLSRIKSFLIRPQMMLALIAVVGIISVSRLLQVNKCQIFPSTCSKTEPPSIDNINDFISSGEKLLINNSVNSIVKLNEKYFAFKQEGIQAFSEGRYADAVASFEKLPSRLTKDPESLIYRNNAFVHLRNTNYPNLPIYTIAVAAPLNDNAGFDILAGVAQAQDIAVKQGMNLQVVIANDRNQPSQSQQIAKKLSDDEKILAVVGHFTSPNTCEALNIYSPNELVVISPTTTLVNIRANPDCGDINKVFFRTTSTSYIEALSLVEYLVKPNGLNKPQPKVVVFYNKNELFSKDLFTQFNDIVTNRFDGRIIASFDLSDPNFNSNQLPPQVKDADALVLLPDGRTNNSTAWEKAIDIIKLNRGEKYILAANTLYLQEAINKTQNATVNRLFIADDWHPKQCGAAEFAQQIRTYWGGDLNGRMALSFDAVTAVLKAIELSGTSVNREQIKEKLSQMANKPETAASSATIKGLKISFDSRGDRKEITAQPIFTVNINLKFDLVKNVENVPCQNQK